MAGARCTSTVRQVGARVNAISIVHRGARGSQQGAPCLKFSRYRRADIEPRAALPIFRHAAGMGGGAAAGLLACDGGRGLTTVW